MKLVDKIKNMFTEEVEEPAKPVIKKEVMKVEIESPEEKVLEEMSIEPKEEKPSPVFFDDKDFDVLEKPKIEKIEKEEPKEETFKEKYKGGKEETKKVFRPSPIISPVYGVLDKNYSIGDIEEKNSKKESYEVSVTNIDEVRKKAYGTLEDDVETTLFSAVKPKHEMKEEEKKNLLDDLLNDDEVIKGKDDDFDLTDDIMNNYQTEKEDKEVSDEDLFNLIDSMYDKEDNE